MSLQVVFARRFDRDKMLKMLETKFFRLSGNINEWFGVRAQKLDAELLDVQKLLHYHNYMTSVSPAYIIIDNIDTHGGLYSNFCKQVVSSHSILHTLCTVVLIHRKIIMACE